ncbi:hypothetical protein TRFO_11595 [Tritrichomonas foetus]|uniref:Uncharacterized protein n=1 Tax=Tritrichomonas foetus TaxID=1144522 RepID=A0A1J4J515_9EUKA|nr:hypothetical protein TRFO_11595 [Tritrichomonas foetus]|eukprot:OHS93785.1 hypothetical protein TRFO_11595 [Tritrichomonas foetus]
MTECNSTEAAEKLYQEAVEESKNGNQDFLEDAAKKLKISADFGYHEAQYIYGLWLMFGKGVEKNLTESAKYFQLSADSGNTNAEYNIGLCYSEGKGVPINAELALHYFECAASKNHASSQFKAAELYRDGIGTKLNEKKAAQLFQSAALNGLPLAQLEYGKCLRDGFGVKKNEEEAKKFLKMAANQKNHEAEFLLAVLQLNEGDISNALINFENAANGGNCQAQLSLSKIYDEGIGVEKDLKSSFNYLKMAADSNSAEAEYFLAFCLKQGKYDSIIQSENSLNEGNANEDIENVRTELVNKYYKMSADNGFVHAQLIVGENFKEKGEFNEALKYFQLAAEQNNATAKFKLGVMLLERGKESQGAALVRSSADDHIGEAQLAYAKFLLKKISNKEDEEKFIYYLKMAADNKNKEAVELYIQCLQNGFCVEKNERESQKYSKMLLEIQ